MFYGASDDTTITRAIEGYEDYEEYLAGILSKLEVVGSGDNLNIIALLDTKDDIAYTYYVGKDDTSFVVEKNGEVDMTDYTILRDFITYCKREEHLDITTPRDSTWMQSIIYIINYSPRSN